MVKRGCSGTRRPQSHLKDSRSRSGDLQAGGPRVTGIHGHTSERWRSAATPSEWPDALTAPGQLPSAAACAAELPYGCAAPCTLTCAAHPLPLPAPVGNNKLLPVQCTHKVLEQLAASRACAGSNTHAGSTLPMMAAASLLRFTQQIVTPQPSLQHCCQTCVVPRYGQAILAAEPSGSKPSPDSPGLYWQRQTAPGLASGLT